MENKDNCEEIKVVKIGGNVVDNPGALASFLADFQQLEGKKILVHGGGVMASKMAIDLGLKTTMIKGRRVTDSETLKLVTMVYAGWINKHIVALLQKNGCNAIGLSGVDANIIPAERRSPIPIDYGFVGDPLPSKVNTEFISSLLEMDIVPVFCAITHDEEGSLLNTNADTIAYTLSVALSATFRAKLYYCFEKEGVLRDVDDPKSLILSMTRVEYEKYLHVNIIAGGMIPKLHNSFNAIDEGVSEVLIMHADNLLNQKGTRLTLGKVNGKGQ
ncbi:MAG: acetylglutamate kinase [Candidatus Saccharimonadaceae bacterium]